MNRELEEIISFFTQHHFRVENSIRAPKEIMQQEYAIMVDEYLASRCDNNMVPINIPQRVPAFEERTHESVSSYRSSLHYYSSSTRDYSKESHEEYDDSVSNARKRIRAAANNWSYKENDMLSYLKQYFPDATWRVIAERLGTKNAKYCCQQWHRVIQASRKGRWTFEEDQLLLKQAEAHVTPTVPGRSWLQICNRLKLIGLPDSNVAK